MKEGKLCQEDSDCSGKQYCYEVSSRCVDYTICNRYNREEAQHYARHPLQCGPCLPGFVAEVLGSGETETLCKKINNLSEGYNDITSFSYAMIYVPISVFIIAIVALAVFVKKQYWRRSSWSRSSQCVDDFQKCNDVCIYGPSAPPLESSPFIHRGKQTCSAPTNNNQDLKDKNILLRANACNNPCWVRSDPNYGRNTNDEDLPANAQLESVIQLPPEEDTSPSSWTPEQVTVQVPPRPFAEIAIESRDNVTNAVLHRHSMGGNNTETTSENNTEENRDRTRTSNVMITQKITMNLNVVNGDC